ncbi:MAG TPA: protein MraZ [Candidatus Cloacimonas sp.]|jgi:MraZ protein|nr:transcriptional regulator MraZ [Candidatus Cloacimonadota bacterium]HCX72928.1 protein MraZ [Candidatus Cloacimonas sp.]
MSGEFLGTFTNSVNKSKWITIPAAFKKKFSLNAKQQVIITIGPENNIAIYPVDNWNHKISKLKQGGERDTQLLLNLRTFASAEQKLESTGRIKLSDELIEIAGIEKQVIIKGEGTFISVWSPERYKQYRRKKLEEHQKTFNSLDYQE